MIVRYISHSTETHSTDI